MVARAEVATGSGRAKGVAARLPVTALDVQRRRSALVIANPKASTVSAALESVVMAALGGVLDVRAQRTAYAGHATLMASAAAAAGTEVVVALGGDGTVNEVLNGLAHAGSGGPSPTVLAPLPGGATNVIARVLGYPNDLVAATDELLGRLAAWAPQEITLGRAGERWFAASAGIGLDAEAARDVDRFPERKARFGKWWYLSRALRAAGRGYVGTVLPAPRLTVTDLGEPAGDPWPATLAIAQNAAPYTYFGARRVDVCPDADLALGLDLAAARLRWRDLGPAAIGVFRGGPRDLPSVRIFHDRTALAIASTGAPFPLQVDGEFVGEQDELRLVSVPRALRVL